MRIESLHSWPYIVAVTAVKIYWAIWISITLWMIGKIILIGPLMFEGLDNDGWAIFIQKKVLQAWLFVAFFVFGLICGILASWHLKKHRIKIQCQFSGAMKNRPAV